jgi:hypothetical protein
MKLFNRGTEAPKGAAPAAPAGPAAASAAVAAPNPSPSPAAPAQAPAPAPAAAPVVPELTAILDANVKDMSEKIAKLASTVESQTTEKGALEAKLEQMEDRMRKLSSLTEMISAQYNPFVGDAPMERETPPAPEVGLAPPPVAAMPMSALAPPALADFPPALEIPIAPQPQPEPQPAFAPQPEPALAWAPAPEPELAPTRAPAQAPQPAPENPEGVALWSAPTTFEASLLMLSWADMLMKHASSREGLLSLVNYYHNVGWIGDPARDQLLAYADGIQTPPPNALGGDWRTASEIHERSLLFVEKLRMIASRRRA